MSGREQKIRERAHALWEQEGRPEGREHHHWQLATREIDGQTGEPTGDAGSASNRPQATPTSSGGLSSGLQPGGTIPGGGPGAGFGSIGTGGGSTGGASTGTVGRSGS